ncbi:hypothetical protein LXF07_24275, partial [Escherichia coli]|nr:hypothetical protein [Escherichia coli]
PPLLAQLEAELARLTASGAPAGSEQKAAAVRAAIARHKAEFAEYQARIKGYYAAQREGEKSIAHMEAQLRTLEDEEKKRHLDEPAGKASAGDA